MIAHSSSRHPAFTLLELLSVVAIVSVLAVILIPVAQRSIVAGKTTASLSNLRQIGVGINSYLSDNNGLYPVLQNSSTNPPSSFWSQAVTPYLGSPDEGNIYLLNPPKYLVSKVLMDPLLSSGKHHFLGDYGGNAEVFRNDDPGNYYFPQLRTATVNKPSRLVSVATAEYLYSGTTVGAWYIDTYNFIQQGSALAASRPQPSFRANGTILALFCDGHTEAIPKKQFIDNRIQYLKLNP